MIVINCKDNVFNVDIEYTPLIIGSMLNAAGEMLEYCNMCMCFSMGVSLCVLKWIHI